MAENPYQAPAARGDDRAIGVLSGSREDLKKVATYQKGILVCILIYLGAVVAQFAVPSDFYIILGLGMLALGVVSTVFVFLLATKIFSTGMGVLLAVCTLLPCIGLITLLVINARATKILRQNGIDVGLMGADLSKI